jgi:serine phosphatase RsbU (regulator of sigma subunit)
MTFTEQKKLILTNQVSILMFLFIISYITILTIFKLISPSFILIIYTLAFSILLIPYMNSRGFYRLTSFMISIIVPVAVLIFSTLTKKGFHQSIDIIYYIIPRLLLLGTLIIPLILIDIRYKLALVLAVLINFLAVLLYDPVTGFFGVGFGSLPVTSENYHLINIFILLPYMLILSGIGFLTGINVKYEIRVQKLLEDIRGKNIELNEQKEYIERIHREISDSINYASRIQAVLLTDPTDLKKYIRDYFIYYKPRNVVSGDFYWFTVNDNKLIFCLADCTGHGVPGAFMSMLGISFLREIITREQLHEPSEILNRLRNEVITALKQRGLQNEQKDGMDISLFTLDISPAREGYENSVELLWAGANNPCWIVSDGKLEELKPDKMPVGIHHFMDQFSTTKVILKKGDHIYLFTDGYVDQFGGPLSKKFMSRHLRELILEYSNRPMCEQKIIFENKIEEWRNGFAIQNEQTDDITLIGIEI